MTPRHAGIPFTVALAASLTAVPALADDSTEAARLFDEGLELFEANELNEACQAFRKSNELEPRVGAALNLARCEEKRGHFAAALAAWNRAAEIARELEDDRIAFAQERAAALEPRVPTLELVPPPNAPDGTTLRVMSPNSPPREVPADVGSLRVDVGTTTVVLEAPGYRSQLREIALEEGESGTLELPLGESLAPPGTAEPSSVAGADGDTMRLVGWLVGGAGVATLGVGAILGFIAKSKLDASNDEGGCDPDTDICADQRGLDLRDQSIAFASGSTALFVIGGLATAAGVTLILVAPDDDQPEQASLRLTVGPGSLGLSGRF